MALSDHLMRLGSIYFGTLLFLGATAVSAEIPQRDVEFRKLVPHITDTCAVVKATPGIFPYRAFTFGPLGLEVRRASSPAEADQLRNLYLGVVADACGISADQVAGYFFCGPQCPNNRRAHLAAQVTQARALAAAFETHALLRLVSVWAPEGEVRVNDLFVMSSTVREAIPSPVMGFVPSGEWKPWSSLAAYLITIDVTEDQILSLTRQMLAIGLSALVKESAWVRLVGVGVGDNESGLILARSGTPIPQVGRHLPDNKRFSILQKLSPDLYYYETN